MARAGMSDEEMTAFLKETFCVDSTFTAAGQRVRASRLGARVCAVSKRRRGASVDKVLVQWALVLVYTTVLVYTSIILTV